MMEEMKQPLLKKVYYESCPGCKQAYINETRRGIPYLDFFKVWVLMLSNSLPISSLFPFIYFMIRDFQIAKSEDNIGFYAGFVGASFMLGRAVTAVPWGMAADRYGRKPVMLAGTLSVIVFNTLFGLSTNFWMAISTRFLLGFFNGLLATMKAYVAEVCGEEQQALGIGQWMDHPPEIFFIGRLIKKISAAWGIGLIFGPAIGGFLALPAEKYPNLISKDSVFGRFPYFLPCLCISLYAAASLLVCLSMPETLHFHGKEDNESCSDTNDTNEENESKASSSDKSLFKNWPLISVIIANCIFLFHNMIYNEVFPLWAESNRKYGGLNLSTTDVGEVLATAGFGLLVFQITLYPMINKAFGILMIARVAACLTIPLLTSYPFLPKFKFLGLKLLLNCASILKNIFSISINTGMSLLQNKAVAQEQRGAANGLSMTAQSIFQAAGPAAGGILISWAQKRLHASFLPGDHMVFFILNVVEFVGLLLTFKPFLTTADHGPQR